MFRLGSPILDHLATEKPIQDRKSWPLKLEGTKKMFVAWNDIKPCCVLLGRKKTWPETTILSTRLFRSYKVSSLALARSQWNFGKSKMRWRTMNDLWPGAEIFWEHWWKGLEFGEWGSWSLSLFQSGRRAGAWEIREKPYSHSQSHVSHDLICVWTMVLCHKTLWETTT